MKRWPDTSDERQPEANVYFMCNLKALKHPFREVLELEYVFFTSLSGLVDQIFVSLSHVEQLMVMMMYFCWNFLLLLKTKVNFTNTAKSSKKK